MARCLFSKSAPWMGTGRSFQSRLGSAIPAFLMSTAGWGSCIPTWLYGGIGYGSNPS
jgi:hypothetical protein